MLGAVLAPHRQQLFADVMVPPVGDFGDDRSEVQVVLLLDAREEGRVSADFPGVRVFNPVGQVAVRHGRLPQHRTFQYLDHTSTVANRM